MIHSILFDKNYYTIKQTKDYLRLHDMKPIKKVHITTNFYRYRLIDPKIFKSFSTKSISPHIKIVIGYL
jgi:hypothetical protein